MYIITYYIGRTFKSNSRMATETEGNTTKYFVFRSYILCSHLSYSIQYIAFSLSHTHTHTHTYIYTYIYTLFCVHVSLFVSLRRKSPHSSISSSYRFILMKSNIPNALPHHCIYLSIYLSIYVCIHSFIYLFIYPSIYLTLPLSLYIYVCIHLISHPPNAYKLNYILPGP